MVRKIKVALDSRMSEDFLIIARTDARKAAGKDEALRRLEAFQEAGADILFYEAPASTEEMAEAGRLFDAPLMANMVEGGATPVLTRSGMPGWTRRTTRWRGSTRLFRGKTSGRVIEAAWRKPTEERKSPAES